jgi:hypothetical protein
VYSTGPPPLVPETVCCKLYFKLFLFFVLLCFSLLVLVDVEETNGSEA